MGGGGGCCRPAPGRVARGHRVRLGRREGRSRAGTAPQPRPSPGGVGSPRWKGQPRGPMAPQAGVTARVTPSCPGARPWLSPLHRVPGACPGRDLSLHRAPSPILGFAPAPPPLHGDPPARGGQRPRGGSQRPPGVVVLSVTGARPDGSGSSARGTLGAVVPGTARPAAAPRRPHSISQQAARRGQGPGLGASGLGGHGGQRGRAGVSGSGGAGPGRAWGAGSEPGAGFGPDRGRWARTVGAGPGLGVPGLGVPPEPGTMDAPPITPGELLCLGSSLAFSGLFYYLYRKKARVVARIQEAPKLQVDDNLPALVSAADGRCLPYVALEGIVLPAKAALTSHYHEGLQGVIQKLLLKEHRLIWNALARSWSESERVLSEQVYTVPFLLASPDTEAVTQVSVESPLRAVCLPLETVYERFQQPAHGFRDLLGQYLSGEKPKGILETEEMLRVGAGLTGIGELALHLDGSLHLQPPAQEGEYFLCLGDWQTVLAELESASGLWKGAAVLCAVAGLAVLLHALCRAYRRARLKQQPEDKEPDGEEAGDGGPEDSCVICLTRPRECVLLGCGHICCCFRCFQALPARLCPICRGPIDRVVPLYQA
ncbi:mitochondrial ubiquitin ligase activator of nfkb 1-A-like isoform 1-T1 [Ciconia maguari]